jgi:hypothetical protein
MQYRQSKSSLKCSNLSYPSLARLGHYRFAATEKILTVQDDFFEPTMVKGESYISRFTLRINALQAEGMVKFETLGSPYLNSYESWMFKDSQTEASVNITSSARIYPAVIKTAHAVPKPIKDMRGIIFPYFNLIFRHSKTVAAAKVGATMSASFAFETYRRHGFTKDLRF